MDVDSLIKLVEAVGTSWPALFLVVLAGIFVLLWKFGKDIINALAANTRKTEEVRKQFKNNGGSTLRDQTDRIERVLAEHIEAAAPVNEWAARKMAEEAEADK
ncbi:hypothetical protein FB00_11205 [Cellulosimicrobium funkei]|uniref:Uncharacterized protein n=1 Tax=Cellulosimicrobium funkei TaxID=264251 RepID=A0A0H2L349_9MICO|nr:hypothetical protein [Cellulosimicrobium funkei]KLN34567.1 hypothetical protein FB00_11205 [Cellulosimicrobium funkei]